MSKYFLCKGRDTIRDNARYFLSGLDSARITFCYPMTKKDHLCELTKMSGIKSWFTETFQTVHCHEAKILSLEDGQVGR
jgi:3-methyladenine DNA glycosylase/8-oxoguanine DNA glycosylase